MAFSSSVVKEIPISSDTVMLLLTYTNTSGSTGGAIDLRSRLASIDYAQANCEVSQAATVNLIQRATPASGELTITTVADEDGTILIYGRPARSAT